MFIPPFYELGPYFRLKGKNVLGNEPQKYSATSRLKCYLRMRSVAMDAVAQEMSL